MTRKRGYSRAFTPADGEGRAYTLKRIPARLLIAATAKAKREGLSLRALMLQQLTDYVNEPEPIDETERCECGDKIGHIEACEFRQSTRETEQPQS